MSKSGISVLVTGVGGGSLGRELIKAFQMAETDYRIIAADMSRTSTGLFEVSSRYITPIASSPDYIKSVLRICKNENVNVVVPGSETELEYVVKNDKLFKENGIEVLSNPWFVIKRCIDKFELINFLQKKGIPYPMTLLCENEHELDSIKNFPFIIKPRSGSGSRNVFLAHNVNEAKFFFKYLKKYGFQPIIQEYVGNYKHEFTIGVLYADNGKLKTSIAMNRMLDGSLSTRQIIEDPKRKEKNVISSDISQGLFDDFAEIRKFGEKIAEIPEANGPVNIQCRKTESDIIPFEVNPRFSGTTASRSLVGYNEPDIFCRYRLFGDIPEPKLYKFGFVLRDLKEIFYSLDEINKIPKA